LVTYFNGLLAFFEMIQNYFNTALILLGFFGFYFWMRTQNRLSAKSNVPVEVKDNQGWYKKEGQQLK